MIVLDTHIWLWWIAGDAGPLSEERKKTIESEDIVAVSAISCFEVAWLERHKRITLSCPKEVWFETALAGSGIVMLPITPSIACTAVDLPKHHNDPQDRIIIATSIVHEAYIVSSDKKFHLYDELKGKIL